MTGNTYTHPTMDFEEDKPSDTKIEYLPSFRSSVHSKEGAAKQARLNAQSTIQPLAAPPSFLSATHGGNTLPGLGQFAPSSSGSVAWNPVNFPPYHGQEASKNLVAFDFGDGLPPARLTQLPDHAGCAAYLGSDFDLPFDLVNGFKPISSTTPSHQAGFGTYPSSDFKLPFDLGNDFKSITSTTLSHRADFGTYADSDFDLPFDLGNGFKPITSTTPSQPGFGTYPRPAFDLLVSSNLYQPALPSFVSATSANINNSQAFPDLQYGNMRYERTHLPARPAPLNDASIADQNPSPGEQNPPPGEQNHPHGEQNLPPREQNLPHGEQNLPSGDQNPPPAEQNPPRFQPDERRGDLLSMNDEVAAVYLDLHGIAPEDGCISLHRMIKNKYKQSRDLIKPMQATVRARWERLRENGMAYHGAVGEAEAILKKAEMETWSPELTRANHKVTKTREERRRQARISLDAKTYDKMGKREVHELTVEEMAVKLMACVYPEGADDAE